jgi:asparagine synthase (glutamine-hydrolysing)
MERYWRLPPPAEHPSGALTEDETAARLREAFDEAVRMRMIADVPLGAFLSGGIDSSAVVASMALQSPQPVKTFSIGFEESEFNELEYASLVAEEYGTEHHQILVKPDSVSLVSRLVRHFDEPFNDPSAIPTFIVSEFAARHVKVVLSGDGGDELFAGYDSFRILERQRCWDRVPLSFRRFMSAVADRLPYSFYGKNFLRMASRPNALERYFENNYAPYFLRRELLLPEWMLPAEAGYLTRTLGDYLLPAGADALSQAMYFEATANLSGDMLVKVDRMSMANSLEVRCPLLDDRLAELAASIPHSWKIRNGKGKHIFLKALAGRLPPRVLQRPKMGFGVPLAEWFRGSLREFLWDHLTSRQFLARGLVSPPFVKKLLKEHDTRRRDNNYWLFSLLMIELWFRDLRPGA